MRMSFNFDKRSSFYVSVQERLFSTSRILLWIDFFLLTGNVSHHLQLRAYETKEKAVSRDKIRVKKEKRISQQDQDACALL